MSSSKQKSSVVRSSRLFKMYWKSDSSPPAPMIVLLLIFLSLSNDLYRFVEPYDPEGFQFRVYAWCVRNLEHFMPDFVEPYRLERQAL